MRELAAELGEAIHSGSFSQVLGGDAPLLCAVQPEPEWQLSRGLPWAGKSLQGAEGSFTEVDALGSWTRGRPNNMYCIWNPGSKQSWKNSSTNKCPEELEKPEKLETDSETLKKHLIEGEEKEPKESQAVMKGEGKETLWSNTPCKHGPQCLYLKKWSL